MCHPTSSHCGQVVVDRGKRGKQIDKFPKIGPLRPPAAIVLAGALLIAAAILLPLEAIGPAHQQVRQEPSVVSVQIVRSQDAGASVRTPLQTTPPTSQTLVAAAEAVIEQRERIAEDALTPSQPTPAQPLLASQLSQDAPPGWNQPVLPSASAAGAITVGDGDNIGSGICGVASTDFKTITTRLRSLFPRDRFGPQNLRVKARLWFEDSGRVQRGELLQSTGSATLDATVKETLGKLDIGLHLPTCAQPITVRVGEPSEGELSGTATPQQVDAWQASTPPAPTSR
jgi:hypothetical protein